VPPPRTGAEGVAGVDDREPAAGWALDVFRGRMWSFQLFVWFILGLPSRTI